MADGWLTPKTSDGQPSPFLGSPTAGCESRVCAVQTKPNPYGFAQDVQPIPQSSAPFGREPVILCPAAELLFKASSCSYPKSSVELKEWFGGRV